MIRFNFIGLIIVLIGCGLLLAHAYVDIYELENPGMIMSMFDSVTARLLFDIGIIITGHACITLNNNTSSIEKILYNLVKDNELPSPFE